MRVGGCSIHTTLLGFFLNLLAGLFDVLPETMGCMAAQERADDTEQCCHQDRPFQSDCNSSHGYILPPRSESQLAPPCEAILLSLFSPLTAADQSGLPPEKAAGEC